MKWSVAILIGFGIIVAGWRLGDNRWFSWVLPAFFVMNCLVLIIVVLLQSGKAADLAGAFGGAGSQTAFGPRGAATVLSQATTWCAVMFMVCAMALALRSDRSAGQGSSVIYDRAKPATKPASPQSPAPSPEKAPATTPGSTPPAGQPPASQNPKP
ncbi:MAG TPA: preprotein translocase subunit SecG [Candidatus Acidoferrum sp.]